MEIGNGTWKEATVVCRLPLPRYKKDSDHINNFHNDENSDMAELLSSGGLIIINIFKYTVLISCFEF